MQSIEDLTICEEHGEKEKFFCDEDQRPLCESCLLAPEHKDHQILPLEIAVANCMEKLQETLNILERKEKEFRFKLEYQEERMAQYKEDALVFKQLVKAEYEKTCDFLWNEENLCLQKVDQEVGINLENLKDSKLKLSQQIQKLQKITLEVEENLDEAPLKMLQGTKDTLNKELSFPELEVIPIYWPTCSITGFREMLMSFYRDITLDPETANHHLILSEDFKSVMYTSIPQDLPDNQQRFDYVLFVLGVQIFTSGKHYWEVEIRDGTDWEVGIFEDFVCRKAKSFEFPEDRRTLIGFKSGNDFFLWNSHDFHYASHPVHKLGIFLDYELGHVAFYNAGDTSLIYSPPDCDFQGSLRPCFSVYPPINESTPGSLIICPRINP